VSLPADAPPPTHPAAKKQVTFNLEANKVHELPQRAKREAKAEGFVRVTESPDRSIRGPE
jgi:hypothetical protein